MIPFVQLARRQACRRGMLGLLLLMAGTTKVSGQDTTVSATMLRVVAEGADEFRTGRPIYLAADHRFPHNVLGPYASDTEARRAVADSGSLYRIFGPYVTPPDTIPDSTPRIVAVRVTVRTPGGRQRHFAVDPAKVDALFFSPSSIDKFVIPYYTRTLGREYAQALRPVTLPVRPIGHCLSWLCGPDSLGMMRRIRVWERTSPPR